MQGAPIVEEWKGWAHTNTTKEGPNGRCSKDLMPKFNPKLLGGERAKEEIERPREQSRGKTWWESKD